jgi:hypothetical protein
MPTAAFLSLALAGTIAPGADTAPDRHRLVVENRADQPIFRLYVETVAPQCRCEDVFGNEVIAPHASVTIDLGEEKHCRYDLAAVMKDGTRIAKSGIDLCAAGKWVIGPGPDSSME